MARAPVARSQRLYVPASSVIGAMRARETLRGPTVGRTMRDLTCSADAAPRLAQPVEPIEKLKPTLGYWSERRAADRVPCQSTHARTRPEHRSAEGSSNDRARCGAP